MLSITNEVDSLIFCCVYFVYDTNYVFPTTIGAIYGKVNLNPCLRFHVWRKNGKLLGR